MLHDHVRRPPPSGRAPNNQNAAALAAVDRLDTSLPRDPACAAVARRLLETFLREHFRAEQIDRAKLVASELVNNAYIHGSGAIELRLALTAGVLRIEVVDQGTGVALRIVDESNRPAVGGHGLGIVEAVSRRWGAFEGTTHVWAELELAPPA